MSLKEEFKDKFVITINDKEVFVPDMYPYVVLYWCQNKIKEYINKLDIVYKPEYDGSHQRFIDLADLVLKKNEILKDLDNE